MSLCSCFGLKSREREHLPLHPRPALWDCPSPVLGHTLRTTGSRPAHSWERVFARTERECLQVPRAGAAPRICLGSCSAVQRSRCSNALWHRTTAQSCIEPASVLRLESLQWDRKGEWVGENRYFLLLRESPVWLSGLCRFSPCSTASKSPELCAAPSIRTPLRRLQLYPLLRPDIPAGSCASCDSSFTAFYYCSEITQSSEIIPGSRGVIRNTAVFLTP